MLNDRVRSKNGLTVKELREFLENLPDDTYVVTGGPDHSYYEVFDGVFTIALRESTGDLTEYYGDDLTPEPEFGMKEYVVVLE